MEPALGLLLGLIAATVAGSLVHFFHSPPSRERTERWLDAAHSAGLSNVREKPQRGRQASVRGEDDRLAVRMDPVGFGEPDGSLRVVVVSLGHGSFGLIVRPMGMGTGFEEAVDRREISLGDESFDQTAYVHGDRALARAILELLGPDSSGRGQCCQGHPDRKESSPGPVRSGPGRLSAIPAR